MTKEQLQARLKELGIKYHHALGVEKLQALLDQALDQAKDATPVAGDKSGDKSPEPSKTEAIVHQNGITDRVYTLKTHGEGFMDLAKEYAKKRGFEVK